MGQIGSETFRAFRAFFEATLKLSIDFILIDQTSVASNISRLKINARIIVQFNLLQLGEPVKEVWMDRVDFVVLQINVN
jgi:hypothetical protein